MHPIYRTQLKAPKYPVHKNPLPSTSKPSTTIHPPVPQLPLAPPIHGSPNISPTFTTKHPHLPTPQKNFVIVRIFDKKCDFVFGRRFIYLVIWRCWYITKINYWIRFANRIKKSRYIAWLQNMEFCVLIYKTGHFFNTACTGTYFWANSLSNSANLIIFYIWLYIYL